MPELRLCIWTRRRTDRHWIADIWYIANGPGFVYKVTYARGACRDPVPTMQTISNRDQEVLRKDPAMRKPRKLIKYLLSDDVVYLCPYCMKHVPGKVQACPDCGKTISDEVEVRTTEDYRKKHNLI